MFLAYLSTLLLGKQYFKMRILFIDTVYPFLKEELEKHHNICDTAYEKSKLDIEEIISDYDGIIIRSRFVIDKEFIDYASELKFIARAGSGLENIDVNYAESKNINCYNAAGGNRQAVAEHTLGMLLSLFNNLNKADQEVRTGICYNSLKLYTIFADDWLKKMIKMAEVYDFVGKFNLY